MFFFIPFYFMLNYAEVVVIVMSKLVFVYGECTVWRSCRV